MTLTMNNGRFEAFVPAYGNTMRDQDRPVWPDPVKPLKETK
jgi:hypothetical protein